MERRHPASTLFPYTTLFRSVRALDLAAGGEQPLLEVALGLREQVEEHLGVEARLEERARLLEPAADGARVHEVAVDRKSTRLNSSHSSISYAVFCLTNKTPRDYCSTFHGTPTPGIYTLSLHDALPICTRPGPRGRRRAAAPRSRPRPARAGGGTPRCRGSSGRASPPPRAGGGWRPRSRGCRRSEEHTSELQSQFHLVCRLLLDK